MRVLIACEYSGVVRDAFARRGHSAWSCDLLPTESPGLHYQGDVAHMLTGWTPVRHQCECDPEGEGVCSISQMDTSECGCYGPTQDGIEYKEEHGILWGRPIDEPRWDLMIAHPPCTYLSSSGMHWTTRGLRDPKLTENALQFVLSLMDAPIHRICIENPVGVISTRIKKQSQYIQPYDFGDDASKKTGLWLKNLPPLISTKKVPPRIVNGKKRWANQCDSGQNKLAPSKERWKERSATYPGIAAAMAAQWGMRRFC
jgi:hypothetical protein